MIGSGNASFYNEEILELVFNEICNNLFSQ